MIIDPFSLRMLSTLKNCTVANTGGSFKYILKRAPACWNFQPFGSALKDSYRDELKTHKRYVLGEGFGPNIS